MGKSKKAGKKKAPSGKPADSKIAEKTPENSPTPESLKDASTEPVHHKEEAVQDAEQREEKLPTFTEESEKNTSKRLADEDSPVNGVNGGTNTQTTGPDVTPVEQAVGETEKADLSQPDQRGAELIEQLATKNTDKGPKEQTDVGKADSQTGVDRSDARTPSDQPKPPISDPHNTSTDIEELRQQLETAEAERDEVQDEYDALLEKVGTIKQRLGERFKELEAEASVSKTETANAVAETAQVKAELTAVKAESEAAKAELAAVKAELSSVKNESEVATAELSKAKAEVETARVESEALRKQLISQKIMFDEEIADERSVREAFELELGQSRAALSSTELAASKSQQIIDEQQGTIDDLRAQLEAAIAEATSRDQSSSDSRQKTEAELLQAREELMVVKSQVVELAKSSQSASQRQAELEQESKEKQLLIGKLRHEAVILNDHLTNALRLVRKDSEGTTVDKELVSNLFVQFATFPRQDTKKFEILQLIANFLDWDDQRRQMVGLSKSVPSDEEVPQQTQMVGMVGRLAEFLESRRN